MAPGQPGWSEPLSISFSQNLLRANYANSLHSHERLENKKFTIAQHSITANNLSTGLLTVWMRIRIDLFASLQT